MFTEERESLQRVAAVLRRSLGDNLVRVVAFGSRVRGDFHGASDFDLLVVVRKRDFGVIGTVVDVVSDEEDRTGIPYAPVVKTAEIFMQESRLGSGFARNVEEEGFVVHV